MQEQTDIRGENYEFIRAQLSLALMKILVAYYSETGNTKKVAEAIHATASIVHDVYLSKIQDVSPDTLSHYEVLFLGSCCHDSDLARPFKRFLDKLPQNPRFQLAGFFTHATYMPEHTARQKELFARWAGKCGPTFEQSCQENRIRFLGYFHCMGAASEPIEAFIRREIIVDEQEWKEYQPELKTHPDSTDIENAKAFTKKVLNQLNPAKKSSC